MLKNISILVSASIGAQAISVLFLPILSRLYDDKAFGVFQIYFSALNLFMMVAALRYEVTLLTARSRFSFRLLLRLVARLTLGSAVLSGAAAWLLFPFIRDKYPGFSNVFVLLPVAFFLAGALHALTYVTTRKRLYKLSAQAKVIQSSFFVMTSMVLALAPFGMLGLVLADMLSRLAVGVLILSRVPDLWREIIAPLKWVHAKSIAWRYREYPIYSMPGSLMSASVGAIVSVTFASLYDLSVVGQYALVERFVLLPVGLISGAAAQVFTGDFAQHLRETKGTANRKFRQVVFLLAAIAIGPALLLYFSAPAFIPLVFGAQWAFAGQIFQIAVPIAVVRFVAGPVNMVLVICDRQPLQLTWETLRFAIMLGLFGVVILLDVQDPLNVMRWYVASVVLSYGMYLLIADRVTANLDRGST